MKYVEPDTPATLVMFEDEAPYTVVWSSPSGHRLWARPDKIKLKPGKTLWDLSDDIWDISDNPCAEGELFVWKEGGYFRRKSDFRLVVGYRRAKYTVTLASRERFLTQPKPGTAFVIKTGGPGGRAPTISLDRNSLKLRNEARVGKDTQSWPMPTHRPSSVSVLH